MPKEHLMAKGFHPDVLICIEKDNSGKNVLVEYKRIRIKSLNEVFDSVLYERVREIKEEKVEKSTLQEYHRKILKL
jgi:hypothetical protein